MGFHPRSNIDIICMVDPEKTITLFVNNNTHDMETGGAIGNTPVCHLARVHDYCQSNHPAIHCTLYNILCDVNDNYFYFIFFYILE